MQSVTNALIIKFKTSLKQSTRVIKIYLMYKRHFSDVLQTKARNIFKNLRFSMQFFFSKTNTKRNEMNVISLHLVCIKSLCTIQFDSIDKTMLSICK